jgi:membrane protein
VWHRFGADDVANQAAKVAYYFFLSLPPALMALFALAGLFGGAGTASWLTTRLQAALPGEAGALVDDFVTEVARTEHPGLLSFGVLATLWAASNVMMALEDSLDVAFDARGKRSFVRRRAVALGTLLAVGVLFLAGSAALLAGPALSRALGLGPVGDAVWSVAQWPLAFACVTGAFWLLYYLLPNRDQSPYRRVLLRSSALAAALWVLATLGFRVYIANFGSYGATYGLLGTVMVLLLWMYLTSMMILLGGEISSQMERRG